MKYVLLVDGDDNTALIGCPDEAAANAVGSAAIMTDGDVSAYLVPDLALVGWERVRAILENGQSCAEIHEAGLPVVVRQPGAPRA